MGLDPRYIRRLRWIRKARAVRLYRGSLRRHWRFVLIDPEPANFSYGIANEAELAEWAATVAGCEPSAARAVLAEPGSDAALKARLTDATGRHWLWTKRSPPFGKRLGWYALVRLLQPGLVIETGVHDGLGSLLILRALERNLETGQSGRLVSFDVNPTAGWLVGAHPQWELRLESSREGLPEVVGGSDAVDMFIYDGWHSYDDERWDLETVAAHLHADGLLISDDAQVTHALADVAREAGFAYFEFREIPVRHFHPGAVLAAGRRPPLTADSRSREPLAGASISPIA
jgi:predicted O-methyltransferase YrrM